MRRLVDSILFLLVAYSVTWPVIRSITYSEDSAVDPAAAVAPLAARLDGADRPTLVIKGALASIPADNAVVVSWEERSISTLAPVAADGTFAAALAGKVGEAGCTIELLDAERRPIARRAVDADVARTGIADLGRIELAAER